MRLLVLALLLAASSALAESSIILQHQGRLLGPNDAPQEGQASITVKIYSDEHGETAGWTETYAVQLVHGQYAIALGETKGGKKALAAADVNGDRWISVSVGGAELTPRLRLGRVPSAVHALDAASLGGVDASEYARKAEVAALDGATFTGPLTLAAPPTLALQAATKGYVDAEIASARPIGLAALSGATFTGPVVLAGAPTDPLGAATKAYVDASSAAGDTARTAAIDATRGYIDTSLGGLRNELNATFLGLAGGTLTGALTLAGPPTLGLHAATKAYVDSSSTGGVLLVSLDFDETSGTTFADGSGRGNDVSATSGGISAGSLGHTGKSISFSGGVVRAPAGNSIANSVNVTAEAWIRPSVGLTGEQVLLNKRGAFRLVQRDGVVEFTVTAAGGACTVKHTGKTVVGTWHHVAGFFNGREATISLDGAYVSTACAKGPLVATKGGEFFIGADDASSASPFTGFLDELRIWSSAPILGNLGSAASGTLPDNLSCKTLLDSGKTTNGTYTIDPDGPTGLAPISVWCDMGNGGWTYAAQNVKFRLDHMGYAQSVQTPAVATEYEFDLYGASSGVKYTGSETPPVYEGVAKGGQAKGRRVFDPNTTVWVFVGGQGSGAGPADTDACQGRWGGWNGGGRGSRQGAGGGGATDIRLRSGDLASRLLVAGGGGGCGYGGSSCDLAGGAGGGLTGGDGQSGNSVVGGKGGTQTAGGQPGAGPAGAGRFGMGGDSAQCNDEGGGGGGWYGGGAGGDDNRPGGGGSSYVAGVTGGTTTAGANNGHGYAEYIFK